MLILSLIILVIIFILNITVGMYYRFGIRHYWFFETLHFLGGFFVVMFLSNFFQSTTLILTGLGTVIFLWESAEILIAKIPSFAEYVKKILKLKDITPSWRDTILDVVLDFAGALTFIYFFKEFAIK